MKRFLRCRLSSHLLPIETGRHQRPPMPRSFELCPCCPLSSVGDEYHLVFECPIFQPLKYHTFSNSRTFSMRSFFAQKDRMIVYKFVSDCVDMINTSSADIFDQVTNNPGTSVRLAEDVKSSSYYSSSDLQSAFGCPRCRCLTKRSWRCTLWWTQVTSDRTVQSAWSLRLRLPMTPPCCDAVAVVLLLGERKPTPQCSPNLGKAASNCCLPGRAFFWCVMRHAHLTSCSSLPVTSLTWCKWCVVKQVFGLKHFYKSQSTLCVAAHLGQNESP